MITAEVTSGRRIAVVLQPGEDVILSIVAACRAADVEQGYIPVFLGAFRRVRLIGTDALILDEDAPLGNSIDVTNAEGLGSGSIASSFEGPVVHLHVAVGAKGDGARARAGHLLSAEVQYVTELVIDEVLAPRLVKVVDPAARGLANLAFGG
jgi:predicted DNA-binding protein with PD1-like motif